VLLGAEGEKVEAKRWYLDTDASNHMTGSQETFAELDSAVMGTVRFGDNSVVTIAGEAPSSSTAETTATVSTGCISSRG